MTYPQDLYRAMAVVRQWWVDQDVHETLALEESDRLVATEEPRLLISGLIMVVAHLFTELEILGLDPIEVLDQIEANVRKEFGPRRIYPPEDPD